MVDATTPAARALSLRSTLGKRRLFRHRAWPEPLGDGWVRVKFMPGWLSNMPSGRVCHIQCDLCRHDELTAFLAATEARYGVHLWIAPIKLPTVWPRGNWWFDLNDHCHALALDWTRQPALRGGVGA